ncbi:DUF485 domain-containing protein [Streptomyces sp. NPDC015127]|uniref:DUF485 domain-containing protein n=1 Tax=Streptomyces sp. NPDC015127 TaxID=3364939 RepID=UPI0036F94655
MSYHQLFPEPPPQPRPAGRHRHEAAPPAWDEDPDPWTTGRRQPEHAWNADRQQPQHPGGIDRQQPEHPWAADPQRPAQQPVPDDRGDMRELGSAYRRLRRVATFTALGYFVLFLILSGYAPGMMTGRVSGGLTTGLVLGLLQLPVALAAIAVYERIARRRVDPLAQAIRQRAEAAAAAPQERAGRPGRPSWQQPTGGARA